MRELKKFQGSTFDTIARRRFVEDQDTILELTGKIQELQHEINCMNVSRDFQDAESRREGPPSIWDTHGKSGNVLANPRASLSAPCPQEVNQWNSSREKPLHSSTVEKSERQKQDQDLRCQSGPSAKNSVIFSGGDSSKNYGADQQRLQISDLHFDKFPHHQRVLAGRYGSRPRYVLVHNFLRKLCCGSQKWRWSIQWMM